MKRFRLSTLMLLIVIFALCIVVVMQYRSEARLRIEEARLRIELESKEYDLETARNYVLRMHNLGLDQELSDTTAGQRK